MDASPKLVSSAWSAVWIWIVLWKASYIWFDYSAFRDNWKSILFFDGGMKGIIISTIVSAAVIVIQFVRTTTFEVAAKLLVAMLSGWFAVYSLANIIFTAWPAFYHYLLLAWSLLIAVWLIKRGKSLAKQALPQLLGLLLITGLVSYFAYDLLETNWRNPATTDVSAQHNTGIRPGQLAPDFETTNLQGEKVMLSQFKGKTVLLNFWTTWCTVCKAEMPHVQKLYEQMAEHDVVILSVNSTSQDSGVEQARRYVEENQLSFPVVLDESGAIRQAYRVRAYPVTFIIDAAGVVRRHHVGAISYEQMKKAIIAADTTEE